jgi:glyoxylase-like metal-dependent hydrolase (beta-lactamase superfamily II)
MRHQIPLDSRADATPPKRNYSRTVELTEDLASKRLLLVNVIFWGQPGARDREWVVIDTGIQGTAGLIARAAKQRYGPDSRPGCIILTHGHFDHVGALNNLVARWETPVYAHHLEQPFLNGTESYPPPDPSVGGGLMANLSPLYPRGPIEVGPWLRVLPEGEVPGMPGWSWVHTPGHCPGHISLWQDSHRVLIAGDAFITTNQESAYSVVLQRAELHGPPMYYTTDWQQARESVRTLAKLEPELVITGHGRPMKGEKMRSALHLLARDFDDIAVPEHGRYVHMTSA